jgi:hypothetical protein
MGSGEGNQLMPGTAATGITVSAGSRLGSMARTAPRARGPSTGAARISSVSCTCQLDQ